MTDNYHSPLLSRVLHGLGWLNLAAALAAFGIIIAGNGPGHHMLLPALGALLAGLTVAAFLFGCGQVVEFIGEIAYNSGRLVTAAEKCIIQGRERGTTLEKIATGTRAMLTGGTASSPDIATTAGSRPAPPPPAPPVGLLPVRRYFYLDLDNQVAGPVSEEKLRQFREASAIDDETQVCQEGTESWQPLTEAILL